MNRSQKAAVIIALVGGVTISCTESGSPMPAPTSAPFSARAIDYSNVWRSTPHLDLSSSEGTFARAYIESDERGARAADERAYYPGHKQTVAGELLAKITERGFWLYPSTTPPAAGAITWWVESFTRHHETFDALVCMSLDDTAFQTSGERWLGPRNPGMAYGRSITVSMIGDQPPPRDMAGTADVPSANVFGSWKVLRRDFTGDCPHTIDPRPDGPVSRPLPSKPANPEPSPGWPAAAP